MSLSIKNSAYIISSCQQFLILAKALVSNILSLFSTMYIYYQGVFSARLLRSHTLFSYMFLVINSVRQTCLIVHYWDNSIWPLGQYRLLYTHCTLSIVFSIEKILYILALRICLFAYFKTLFVIISQDGFSELLPMVYQAEFMIYPANCF